ncbi:hypothetical protein, partial [Staphylococcus pseudintermedius]|uniref:hypothetical protein n=1 Tax=Staphylococcus pseudintermedius TaxID=283734 RepID=UPI001654FE74
MHHLQVPKQQNLQTLIDSWTKILLAVPQLLIAKSSQKGTAPQEKVMQKIIEIIILIIDVID